TRGGRKLTPEAEYSPRVCERVRRPQLTGPGSVAGALAKHLFVNTARKPSSFYWVGSPWVKRTSADSFPTLFRRNSFGKQSGFY
ncbi:hypothetical protein Q7C36_013961, partial [Tachysurus vachellii]